MLFIWKYIICLGIFMQISAAQKRDGCPPLEKILPCRCLQRGNEFQIWCSHSDLPRVLDGLRAVAQYLPKAIDELILENNYLPSLPGRTFLPLKVMRLMLRYNRLERVSNDWLAGLETSLMELFIVEPELRTLPEDSLLHLTRLEAVTLQTNLLKRLPLFSGLANLRYLQLESLSLLELSPRNFKNNPSLEKLHINLSPRLSRLEANFLHDLPRLELVNISFCGLNWMHPRAITRLPQLKELSLVGNKITDAGMVGRSSRDLPLLETIRLDYNYIDKLSEAAFVDLPSLQKLYLSNNRINELHHGAFHRVPKLRSLDLNRNQLRRVHPESFLQQSGSGLEELWLVENDIRHVADLRSLLDALPRLTFLDMSFNNLEAIPFGALRGHPTLEYLHLDYNKIHLIEREAFMAMPALRELRLRNNSLSDNLATPFWNLPALKGLDLSGNYFRRLKPRLLANLPSLRRFDLSANLVEFVDKEAFVATPSLEHVNLSRNALASLHPSTFRHLANLYELDVSFNELVEVPRLSRGVEYLHVQFNNIVDVAVMHLPALRMLNLEANRLERVTVEAMRSLPQLRRLYLGRNLLQKLEEGAFGNLHRLEVLHLNENRLVEIHPGAFMQMFELRDLNLNDNRLDVIVAEVFRGLSKLRKLRLSRNLLSEILPNMLDSNVELELFDASDNVLVQLSRTFINKKRLRYLDLSHNRIKHLNPEILASLAGLSELKLSRNFINELKQGVFDNLQHLRLIELDNNEVEIVEMNAIRALPMLKTLKLNTNKIKELPKAAFNNLPTLQEVELQENRIESISPAAFNAVSHLLMLNLSRNELVDLDRAGLRSMRSLEMLDLSGNKLTRIVAPILERMEWLVELKLDDNAICRIQGAPFNNMARLRVLSMRNNRLVSFPESAIFKLRGNLAVLDIDGNPLSCGCGLVWLQNWLQEALMMVQGPKCADGSWLRDLRLECGREEVEMAAPGCEAELLSAPSTGVVAHWMKLKGAANDSSLKENHLAPSPEESEYFYDEYIDYPAFNETQTTTTQNSNYVVGDTPTLYAAPSRNKTVKPDIPKEIVNSPSTSGFTFFGVPLPNLNFNNLLPQAKKVQAERKTAIVNSPPVGKVGRLHPPMPTVAELLNLSARPPLPEFNRATPDTRLRPPMPSVPEVQTGGFVPVLPGSGGFMPIIPLHLQQNVSTTTVTSTILNPLLLVRKEEVVSQQIPASVTVTSKPSILQSKIQVVAEESMKSSVNQSYLGESMDLVGSTATSMDAAVIEEIITTTNLPVINATTYKPELETANVNKHFPKTVLEEPETVIVTTDMQIPVIEGTPLVTIENVPVSSDVAVKDGGKLATPLSVLLVPGGQQPQFRPHGGKSTVVKVESPLLASMESNQVSEALAQNNREGKTTKDYVVGDESNWYFANYNKTNLEPYVSRVQADDVSSGCRGCNGVQMAGFVVLVCLRFLCWQH